MSEKEKKDLENTVSSAPAKAAKQSAKSDAAKKSKSSDKKAKSGVRLRRYLREMKSELKKVVWPTKSQTAKNTGTVIVCVIIVGAFVWVFDGVAGQLISALINLFGR